MREDSNRLNPVLIDKIEHFPMPDLIRRMFPGHQVRDRGVMSSPLRQDRNPSFSCFRGHGGVWLGKDLAQGVTYNNISFYRAAVGGSFDDAVDALSRMLFGQSAVLEATVRRPAAVRPSGYRKVSAPVENIPGALQVTGLKPLSAYVPKEERDYWRGRGISDANIVSACFGVDYINTNAVGRTLLSPSSNLPVYDKDGNEMKDDGRRWAVGLPNEIGGWSLRSADNAYAKGFKGCTSSFFSLILSDGTHPVPSVSLVGDGIGWLERVMLDTTGTALCINAAQRFINIRPAALPFAAAFLNNLHQECVDEREVRCLCALFSSMNAALSGRFAVVEGLYDALSFRELQAREGKGFQGGIDLLILNSTSNARWAAPLLAMGTEVRLYLDHDLRSGAGQKAENKLFSDIRQIVSSLPGYAGPRVTDGSALFASHKDLNAALTAGRQPKKTVRRTAGKEKSFVKHI